MRSKEERYDLIKSLVFNALLGLILLMFGIVAGYYINNLESFIRGMYFLIGVFLVLCYLNVIIFFEDWGAN